MPAVIFFECLNLEQKSLFPEGHYLELHLDKNKTCVVDMSSGNYGSEVHDSRLIAFNP